VYNIIDEDQAQTAQDEKTRESRSRFNGRVFLSWLQDVDDKWERIKVIVSKGIIGLHNLNGNLILIPGANADPPSSRSRGSKRVSEDGLGMGDRSRGGLNSFR
jgi:hypothetical protein